MQQLNISTKVSAATVSVQEATLDLRSMLRSELKSEAREPYKWEVDVEQNGWAPPYTIKKLELNGVWTVEDPIIEPEFSIDLEDEITKAIKFHETVDASVWYSVDSLLHGKLEPFVEEIAEGTPVEDHKELRSNLIGCSDVNPSDAVLIEKTHIS